MQAIPALIMMLLALVLMPAPARAACACRCFDGEMKPICSTLTETRPRCPHAVCPINRPALESIQSPTAPAGCVEKTVRNPFTGADEVKTVCQ